VARLVEQELATGKRLGCYATVVGAASGGDPAVAVRARCPPPGVEST
jgi:hypothetical protein